MTDPDNYRRDTPDRAGKKAALAGKPKTANNRQPGTIFYDDWCDGWNEIDQQRPRDESV